MRATTGMRPGARPAGMWRFPPPVSACGLPCAHARAKYATTPGGKTAIDTGGEIEITPGAEFASRSHYRPQFSWFAERLAFGLPGPEGLQHPGGRAYRCRCRKVRAAIRAEARRTVLGAEGGPDRGGDRGCRKVLRHADRCESRSGWRPGDLRCSARDLLRDLQIPRRGAVCVFAADPGCKLCHPGAVQLGRG